MKLVYPAFTVFATVVMSAAPSVAYTPKWLQCDGELVVTGADAGTKPAHDLYIYDDDNKNLFVYSADRHRESIEPVRVYNDNEIRWSMDATGSSSARWEGRIDRKTLGLRLNYVASGSTLTWTEQCKPTSPVAAAVAADQPPKPASVASADKKSSQ
jgi:uncharacterized membrane protein